MLFAFLLFDVKLLQFGLDGYSFDVPPSLFLGLLVFVVTISRLFFFVYYLRFLHGYFLAITFNLQLRLYRKFCSDTFPINDCSFPIFFPPLIWSCFSLLLFHYSFLVTNISRLILCSIPTKSRLSFFCGYYLMVLDVIIMGHFSLLHFQGYSLSSTIRGFFFVISILSFNIYYYYCTITLLWLLFLRLLILVPHCTVTLVSFYGFSFALTFWRKFFLGYSFTVNIAVTSAWLLFRCYSFATNPLSFLFS